MDKYDDSNAKGIESYAKFAVGKSFIEIFDGNSNTHNYSDFNKELNSQTNKGSLGQIVEKYYFGIKNNSEQMPDFPNAGVELKVCPYVVNKNGTISAKERLIITLINYMEVINEVFEKSHAYSKMSNILLMEYKHDYSMEKADYTIDYAGLMKIPEKDLIIIKKDFEFIVNKIREGKAHLLSEADTTYLGACTKGSSAQSVRKQPNSNILAKQRAFALKSSYMTYFLRNIFFKENKNSIAEKQEIAEPIIKNIKEAENFESLVKEKIMKYKGKSIEEISNLFGVGKIDAKNRNSILTFRMLGIKSNKAEEFEKANIVVKTIRLENDNSIEQDMSFKNFKFTEVVKENVWEESELYKLWSSVKFLFVVFKTNDDKKSKNKRYCLYDSQFWNIPEKDLDTYAQDMWLKLKETINNGIKTINKNGKTYNNLPKKSDNYMCHVRPKGTDSNDKYPLPNGGEFTKQCYWLNKSYIKSQLECTQKGFSNENNC